LVSARLIVEDDAAPSVWTALDKPSKGSRFISVLEFDVPNFPEKVEPGSYVFLHVAEVASLEFHPISISNCPRRKNAKSGAGGDPNSSRLTLHVLDAGSNFSHKLRLRIEALQKEQARAIAGGMAENEAMACTARALQVRVDGPYGRAQVQLHRYRVLVLVGGGIGITPLLSCLDYLVEQLQSGASAYAGLAQVHLCWSSRLQSSFEWSRELLQRSQMLKQQQVQLHLFVWAGPDPVPRVQQVKQLAAKHGPHRRSHLHQHGVQEKTTAAQIEMQPVPAAVHAAASPVSAQFSDASSLPQSPSLASGVEDAATTKPSQPHPHVPHQRVAPVGPRTSTIVGANEYFASDDSVSPTFHSEDGASSMAAAVVAVERPVYIAPVALTPEEMLSIAAENVAADGDGVRHRRGSLTPSMVRLHAEAESVMNRADEADEEQEHGASAAAAPSPNTAPAASAAAGSCSAAVSSGESHQREHSVSGISCAGGSHAPDCLSAWSPPVEFGIADYGTFFKQLASDAAALDLPSLPPHHAARMSGVSAHSVAVLACGPPGLVADVQRRAQKLNFHFHKESFLF
jgi:NAD(P)H-flavin reductase